MTKWADYLISAVRYNGNHKIVKVMQHEDKDGSVAEGIEVERAAVASNIKNGKTYMTIYSGPKDRWGMGKKVNTFKVGGEYCIRVDNNKADIDNLGEVVEF
ncbi:MAG: DUF3892 domain-containing protein [Nitrosopumilaceae archaeon]